MADSGVVTASQARPERSSQDVPAVSVLVTTKNVERTLEACLLSIREQDFASFELLVVDNHSTDKTQAIAHRLADQVIVAGPERSAQRNLGVRAAAAPWILWIDADMVLEPDVLSSAMREVAAAGTVAVSIPERTVGPGFWTACRALERSCYLDDSSLFNPRLLRRDYLLGLGGFDESMAGPEDTDLRLRLRKDKALVGHTSSFIDHDEGHLTLREVARKRVYYGRSLPSFAAANPGAVRDQARSTVAAFVRHRRRLLGDPLHAGGLLLMRAVEGGAYVVGAWQGRRTVREPRPVGSFDE